MKQNETSLFLNVSDPNLEGTMSTNADVGLFSAMRDVQLIFKQVERQSSRDLPESIPKQRQWHTENRRICRFYPVGIKMTQSILGLKVSVRVASPNIHTRTPKTANAKLGIVFGDT